MLYTTAPVGGKATSPQAADTAAKLTLEDLVMREITETLVMLDLKKDLILSPAENLIREVQDATAKLGVPQEVAERMGTILLAAIAESLIFVTTTRVKIVPTIWHIRNNFDHRRIAFIRRYASYVMREDIPWRGDKLPYGVITRLVGGRPPNIEKVCDTIFCKIESGDRYAREAVEAIRARC